MKVFSRTLAERYRRLLSHLLHPRAFYAMVILVIALVVTTGLLVGRTVRARDFQETLSEAQENLLRQIDALAAYQEILSEQSTALLSLSEASLSDLRDDTQASLRAAQEQLSAARRDLGTRIDEQSARTTTAITTWRPRVALISCNFSSKNGVVSKQGSGTLFKSGTGVQIITNKHVVTHDDGVLESCSVSFADNQVEMSLGQVTVALDGERDVAYVTITKPAGYLVDQTAASLPKCAARPAIGDRLVILGYPAIGSHDDVTATEGILSGYEGDYLITSAKVEQGNSGGAAIAVAKNCYAGIPTFVQVGQAESLARILSADAL